MSQIDFFYLKFFPPIGEILNFLIKETAKISWAKTPKAYHLHIRVHMFQFCSVTTNNRGEHPRQNCNLIGPGPLKQ